MVDRPSSTPDSYWFGPFRLDVHRQQLYKDGQPVELPRRLVRVLQLLVENHGRDLERAYLMEQLWPARVVEENNLTTSISMLRKVLGDEADQKKYILTNPGRGYRFVGEVTETGPKDPAAQEVRPSGTIPASSAAVRRSFLQRSISLPLVGAAVAVLLLLVLFGFRQWNQRETHSIAVLPFQSQGSEHGNSYLELGITDGIIMRLRNIRHVVVRPTTDVAKYQGAPYDPLALGKELHVVSLLDGTVQKEGDQVWLRVKLLRVKDGAILWSHEYHANLADILILQDQIADQATRVLAVRLNSAEQQSIHRHYTGSSEAYQAYMVGRHFCTYANPTALDRGVAYLQQATAKDPQFALAYASLAACYMRLGHAVAASKGFFSQTEAAAQRALTIDRNLQEAYLPLAWAKAYGDWDFPAAEAAFHRSIDLASEGSEAHSEARIAYAEFLNRQGRFQEALREAHRVTDLDPFSWEAQMAINDSYFFDQRYEDAAAGLEKGLEFDLSDVAWYLAWIDARQGRPMRMIDQLVKVEPRNILYTACLAYIYALKGMNPSADSYLQKLSQYPDAVDDYQLGLIYVARGDKDRAFQFLQHLRDQHSEDVLFLKFDPRLQSLHADPRFSDLLRGVPPGT